MAISQRRRILFGGILWVFTAIICLFILEFSTRFVVLSFQAFSYSAARSIIPLGHSDFVTPPTIPVVPYELKANTKGFFKLKPFDINRHGLRDQNYNIQKPENAIRFAVVGDSYTMGSGVAIENVWHSRLEDRLSTSEHVVEFLNFGVGGYNLDDYHSVIRHKISPFDPDQIVIAINGNDLRPNHIPRHKEIKKVNGFFRSFFLRVVKFGLFFYFGQNDPSKRHEKFDHDFVKKEFLNIKQASRLPVTLVFLVHGENQKKIFKQFESVASKVGLTFISVYLSEDKKFQIYPTDSHPNAIGHKLFFEQMHPYFANIVERS